MAALNSRIYIGEVRHRRFSPKAHNFSYKLFFLAIDLDEIKALSEIGPWFKWDKFAPLSFKSSDYLQKKSRFDKQQVWQKVTELGGRCDAGKVMFIGQMRCFGLYFSPINLYYCYDLSNQLNYLLAEVSNTPWNERHYYLIDVSAEQVCDKSFHVSPFMDLQMKYHWRIKAPAETLSLHLESRIDNQGSDNELQNTKLFDASLAMKSLPFNNKSLLTCLLSIPVMTLKTLAGIYWQALKLYLKGVPYVAHSQKRS